MTLFGQNSAPYRLDLRTEIPLYTVGAGMNLASIILHKKKPEIKPSDIGKLNIDNINKFDRSATKRYSIKAQKASDVLMYLSIASPLAMMAGKNVRMDSKHFFAIGLQTYMLGFGITGMTKELNNRYRPYVYNENVPLETKLKSTSNNSFFSGHTSLSTMSMFFLAKTFSDYYPNSSLKPLIWSAAVALPATTGILRYFGGKHFFTDIIIGFAVGSVVGILVPQIHTAIN